MKRRILLVAVSILILVTLACSPCGLISNLTGGEGEIPEIIQPGTGDEQPAPPPESGGEEPASPPESGGAAPEIAGLDSLDSYRLHITWRVQNEDGSEAAEMTITEEWIKEPPATHLVMSRSEGGSEETPFMEMITIGDTTWMKMGDTWMQMESGEEEDFSDAWSGLTTDVGGWTPAGEETVNGVHCKHYTSGDETSITVPDPKEGGTVTVRVQGEAWVADQAGLPPVTVRERTQIEGGFFPLPVPGAPSGETGIVYLEYDVTDINASITIEPPE